MAAIRKSQFSIFDMFNSVLLFLIAWIAVVPFLYVIVMSFSGKTSVPVFFGFFPSDWSVSAYLYLFSSKQFMHSLWNTVQLTLIGTALNLTVTTLMAYPLSKKDLPGRNAMLLMVLFTMLFSGGIIPLYLVVKSLGLLNSLWSVILPGVISAFNLIIIKNFFLSVPESLEESATIDGAGYFRIFTSIILPLSLPMLAAFTVFYAVHNWNQYFNAVMFINKTELWPLQVRLRQMVVQAALSDEGSSSEMMSDAMPRSIQMAAIVVAAVPIMIVYPFLQKHFVKGVMLGSVKG